MVPPSIWTKNYQGSHLLCLDCFQNARKKYLTIFCIFLICIFSLSPIWVFLGSGIPGSTHTPTQLRADNTSVLKDVLSALIPLSGSNLQWVEDTTQAVAMYFLPFPQVDLSQPNVWMARGYPPRLKWHLWGKSTKLQGPATSLYLCALAAHAEGPPTLHEGTLSKSMLILCLLKTCPHLSQNSILEPQILEPNPQKLNLRISEVVGQKILKCQRT